MYTVSVTVQLYSQHKRMMVNPSAVISLGRGHISANTGIRAINDC